MSKRDKAMCDWLGHGEMDIALMISMGMTTMKGVRLICRTLTDSPWFRKPK